MFGSVERHDRLPKPGLSGAAMETDMSAFITAHAPAAERSAACARLGRILVRLADELRWAWRIRRDLKQVHELDDRMLADIGLVRADIDRLVRRGSAADEIRGLVSPTRSKFRPVAPDAGAHRPRIVLSGQDFVH